MSDLDGFSRGIGGYFLIYWLIRCLLILFYPPNLYRIKSQRYSTALQMKIAGIIITWQLERAKKASISI
jgi:hypothetical protein